MKVSNSEELGRDSRVLESGRRRLVRSTRTRFSVLPTSQMFCEGSRMSGRYPALKRLLRTDCVASSAHHRSSGVLNGTCSLSFQAIVLGPLRPYVPTCAVDMFDMLRSEILPSPGVAAKCGRDGFSNAHLVRLCAPETCRNKVAAMYSLSGDRLR